ncbi:hypothetical protein KQX54_018996 [Cotesia glomerata]|uniref:Uncharacterized protein n=1 Tax=Cotesia glomerata TaxID=32391 RepID=A0AAV7I7Y3_COTGL|nr:hypothetical protein KQX54_018996 [Cotesia glomerata]
MPMLVFPQPSEQYIRAPNGNDSGVFFRNNLPILISGKKRFGRLEPLSHTKRLVLRANNNLTATLVSKIVTSPQRFNFHKGRCGRTKVVSEPRRKGKGDAEQTLF